MADTRITVVTGDIGAGKSTVSGILARNMNAVSLNADIAAKNLWLHDDVKSIFVSRWGAGILDASGKIITPELSRLIFSDKREYDFCCAIIHPLVMSELEQQTRGAGVFVVEIPLLPEVGRPSWAERVIYVAAEFSVRAARCRESRGWNEEELLRREKFLLPREQRINAGDCVLHNDGDIYELEREIKTL